MDIPLVDYVQVEGEGARIVFVEPLDGDQFDAVAALLHDIVRSLRMENESNVTVTFNDPSDVRAGIAAIRTTLPTLHSVNCAVAMGTLTTKSHVPGYTCLLIVWLEPLAELAMHDKLKQFMGTLKLHWDYQPVAFYVTAEFAVLTLGSLTDTVQEVLRANIGIALHDICAYDAAAGTNAAVLAPPGERLDVFEVVERIHELCAS